VLSFRGYFKESVVENPNENYRIRKMIIYYYLNDGTIYIMEPRVENSGIPQGVSSAGKRSQKHSAVTTGILGETSTSEPT